MIKNLLLTSAITCLISTAVFSQSPLELESERTAYSKTFLKEDGTKEQLLSVQPMHYFNIDTWLPIESKLISSGTGFVNETNIIKSTFPEVIAPGEEIHIEIGDTEVHIDAVKSIITYSEVDGVQQLNPPLMANNGKTVNDSLVYEDIYSGMTDRYLIGNGSMKNEFQLAALPSVISGVNSGYFGFQERIRLPQNWSIRMLGTSDRELITSSLEILDENNTSVFTIPSPVFFESGSLSDDGASSVEGGFLIDKDGEDWLLSTLVPVEWLKNPDRIYPVVLDPSLTLSGADGGWMSAVNLVNNPNFVFIGVCCGNQEHRAWIKFNTASIPDASCVTNVELELYINGVGGATAELVHAYDMTGAFGPYAGIDVNVLNDMTNGYYSSFTLGGVGTYGWYDLGPGADVLLESQLPGDWYQVALVFDNEPSTNWKRFTAASCRLRVAYDDPPCTPLPVGISKTRIDCVDDFPVMQWTTVTESNNDYFTVSKSNNGVDYHEVGVIQGNGNSSTEQNYIWRGNDQLKERSYFKLSQTDIDGETTHYSPLIYEVCEPENPVVFVDEKKTIHVTGRQISYVELRDNMGRIMASAPNDGEKNEWILHDPNFASGFYTASIYYEGSKSISITFLYAE